ncbi:MAG: ATP-binding protein [Pyrinomonadaceae bacterium]
MSQEKINKQPLYAVPNEPETGKRDNFQKQSDADNEPEVCPLCFGSGMEYVGNKGVRICSCKKQNNHSNLLITAKIPKRYEKCHFHNYKARNLSQDRGFQFASRLAMEFPAVERGLILMGDVGVGKTHLAVSILKGLTERGFGCLFYEFGTLLKEIQASYNPVSQTSELNVLSPVLDAEILVLDEIGASKPTDWVRDTMAHIINSRYNDKKLTIFTTNYSDDPKNDREETFEDRIGVRLRSRLFEMCQTVVMTGDDYRKSFDRS